MSVISDSTLSAVNQTTLSSQTASTAEDLSNNFMTLLIAQLQNQDPLKPLENAELTSQLAQINTVNGVEKLNKTMTGITGQIEASQQIQATALMGHGVLVPGERVLVGTGESTPFGLESASGATGVVVTVKDSLGQVVRTFEIDSIAAGVESFTWDAKLADGTAAPDGAYSVSATAEKGAVSTLNFAVVTGVSKTPTGPKIDLGTLQSVSLDQVRQVISRK
jgi:flagellar basal-body rod modification protein FlgD